MNETLSALGSILSAIVAIMALAHAIYQSKVKKYEIMRDYRSTIIAWYSETVELLIELRSLLVSVNDKDDKLAKEQLKLKMMSHLSSQIEVGRLYFPNLDKGDGYGKEKPKAFQGYRNLTLDFLVFSYNIFLEKDVVVYAEHLVRLQREFTSIICETVGPEEFLNELKKHSDKYFSHNLTYHEFLEKDPANRDLFFPRPSNGRRY
jgi:hypothetical protein